MKINEVAIRKLATEKVQDYAWDDELVGFGVVFARTGTKTFVARRRVRGESTRRKVVLGRWPELSAADARAKAEQILARMGAGVDPRAKAKADGAPSAPAASGPTLRDGLTHHIGKMERGENRRGKVCSPESIAVVRNEIERHYKEWLDRPLVDLTADAIEEVRDRIERETTKLAASNPKNPPGRALANRLLAHISAIWRSWHKRYGLPVSNPAERLSMRALKPRETRVDNDDLPKWYAKVNAIENGVRRDLQLVACFSGVRAAGVRNLRWDEIDEDQELIQIQRAKGDRPYTIPLTKTLADIFDRRRDENTSLMSPYGGDHGYVFPSLTREKPYRVIPVAEVKERRTRRNARGQPIKDDDGDIIRDSYLPGIHPMRRTYNSIAIEIGVPLEVRERLMNHAGRGVNVRHYGVPQDWSNTREWADKIEIAIWQRIKGERRGKRRSLRAV